MKYLPLVWAALTRKPARAVLTLLSVTVAFTLLGLMIGLNASFQHIIELSRADRIYVNPRFGGDLTVAMGHRIGRLDGVTQVGIVGWVGGYYQDPRNNVFVMLGDDAIRRVRADWPLTPRQWDLIRDHRPGIIMSRLQAARWHKKAGDSFVVRAAQPAKADGTKFWTFQVLDIGDEFLPYSDGYIIGNFDYFDKSRIPADQGKIGWFEVLVADPAHAPQTARAIDQIFANSASPTKSATEKAESQANGFGGLNVATITRDISVAGLFMILFLTANGIAQSVRERIPEFAALKTMGFTDRIVMMLVFAEAAAPCVLGAALGVALAAGLAAQVPRICPPGWGLPAPYMAPVVYVSAALGAAAIALASSALPILRLRRLDVAAALSGR